MEDSLHPCCGGARTSSPLSAPTVPELFLKSTQDPTTPNICGAARNQRDGQPCLIDRYDISLVAQIIGSSDREEGHCLSHEGSGDTRRRRCHSHGGTALPASGRRQTEPRRPLQPPPRSAPPLRSTRPRFRQRRARTQRKKNSATGTALASG